MIGSFTLWNLLGLVNDRTEGLTGDNMEYERGQLELLADMFPIPGVDTRTRVDQLRRIIRANRKDGWS